MESTEEKIEAVRTALGRALPGAVVAYHRDADTHDHKFRIDDPRPRCWLHLTAECVDDYEAVILINFLNIYGITRTFRDAKEPVRLRLTSSPHVERLL